MPTSFSLVTKKDLRDDKEYQVQPRANNMAPEKTEQGLEVARKISAANYSECSAYTVENLEYVFDTEMMTALFCKNRKKKQKRMDASIPACWKLSQKPRGAQLRKYATAISPERTNATGRVKRPSAMSGPPTFSSHPASPRIVMMSRRPGRVREIIPVNIPRPRKIISVRAHPRYIELRNTLWTMLTRELDNEATGSKNQ